MLAEYEPQLLEAYNPRMARKMGLKHYDKDIAVSGPEHEPQRDVFVQRLQDLGGVSTAQARKLKHGSDCTGLPLHCVW